MADLYMAVGETPTWTFTCQDANGPVSLATASAIQTTFNTNCDDWSTTVLTKAATRDPNQVTNPGVCTVSLLPADSLLLTPGLYYFRTTVHWASVVRVFPNNGYSVLEVEA